MGAMCRIPVEKLIKLITMLEKNIRDGAKVRLMVDMDKSEAGDDTLFELLWDKVLQAVDAALAALTIMTSASMPKQVYIEDTMESAVKLVKNQLENVIYPSFDSIYKTPSGEKKGLFF